MQNRLKLRSQSYWLQNQNRLNRLSNSRCVLDEQDCCHGHRLHKLKMNIFLKQVKKVEYILDQDVRDSPTYLFEYQTQMIYESKQSTVNNYFFCLLFIAQSITEISFYFVFFTQLLSKFTTLYVYPQQKNKNHIYESHTNDI